MIRCEILIVIFVIQTLMAIFILKYWDVYFSMGVVVGGLLFYILLRLLDKPTIQSL